MSIEHSFSAGQGAGNERPLWIALVLTFGFLVAGGTGGVVTKCLALIADAAHMFTSAAALAIAPADDAKSRNHWAEPRTGLAE